MLESKLQVILEMNKHAAALKSLLDERIRTLTEARENERKFILSSLLERVMADLKDPKTVTKKLYRLYMFLYVVFFGFSKTLL